MVVIPDIAAEQQTHPAVLFKSDSIGTNIGFPTVLDGGNFTNGTHRVFPIVSQSVTEHDVADRGRRANGTVNINFIDIFQSDDGVKMENTTVPVHQYDYRRSANAVCEIQGWLIQYILHVYLFDHTYSFEENGQTQ